MIAYLAILSTSLAGFAGVKVWAIAAGAIALASISFARYRALYDRANEAGLSRIVDAVLLRSFANALVAASAAYGFGWALRLV